MPTLPHQFAHRLPRPTAREIRWGIAVLVLALVVRVAWAAIVPVVPMSDSAAYDLYARNIVLGHGYGLEPSKPSLFWPPGAAFLVAMAFAASGVTIPPTDQPYAPLLSYASVEVLNVVLGVGIVACSMLLAWKRFGARAGLAAGLIVALWPMGIGFSSMLQSEIPCTFFLLLGMVAFEFLRFQTLARAFACGLLFAFASYVRPTMLLVPVVLYGIEFLFERTRQKTFVSALVCGIVMACVIAPWTYRNYKVFNEFVPISANSGSNLWMGNNPNTTGEYMPEPEEYKHWGEVERDKELGKIAKQYIKSDPGAFVARTARKFVRLHERQTIGIGWNERGFEKLGVSRDVVQRLKQVSTAYWYAMLLGALAGLVFLLRTRGWLTAITTPFLVVWMYMAALHAIYVFQDRYTFPFTPLIGCLAAIPLAGIADLMIKKRVREPGPYEI